jgi:hypothetical protein
MLSFEIISINISFSTKIFRFLCKELYILQVSRSEINMYWLNLYFLQNSFDLRNLRIWKLLVFITGALFRINMSWNGEAECKIVRQNMMYYSLFTTDELMSDLFYTNKVFFWMLISLSLLSIFYNIKRRVWLLVFKLKPHNWWWHLRYPESCKSKIIICFILSMTQVSFIFIEKVLPITKESLLSDVNIDIKINILFLDFKSYLSRFCIISS